MLIIIFYILVFIFKFVVRFFCVYANERNQNVVVKLIHFHNIPQSWMFDLSYTVLLSLPPRTLSTSWRQWENLGVHLSRSNIPPCYNDPSENI